MGISSTTSCPTRDNQRRMRYGNTPPKKEDSSKREYLKTLNKEALRREAFVKLNAQVDVEEELKMEQKMRQMVIMKEEASREILMKWLIQKLKFGTTIPREKAGTCFLLIWC